MAAEGTHTPSQDPSAGLSGDYAWGIATMYPEQGSWGLEDYYSLTDGSNRRVEFVDGRLEFLPMPTELHQQLAGFLYHALLRFVTRNPLGRVPFPPIRVRVSPGKVREPDVLFLAAENAHKRHNRAWDGADLVVEVVSGDHGDRKRDYVDKVDDYARIGIREYWIVDHEARVVIVHRLDEGTYSVAGRYTDGETAASVLLDGFTVDVAALFKVADDIVE